MEIRWDLLFKKEDGFHLAGMIMKFIDGLHVHSYSKLPYLELCVFYNFTTQTWPIGFVENMNHSYQPILKYPQQIRDFQFILNHTGFVIVMDVEQLWREKQVEELLHKNFMEFFEIFWIPQNFPEFLIWSFNGLPFGPLYMKQNLQKNTTDMEKNWIFCSI